MTDLNAPPMHQKRRGRPPKHRPEYDITTDENSRVTFLRTVAGKLLDLLEIRVGVMDSDAVFKRKADEVRAGLSECIALIAHEIGD